MKAEQTQIGDGGEIPSWGRPGETGGFTLLQLLVVLAILAVLMSMVYLVAGSARQKARQTACLNNLRECFLATTAYSSDQDGCLPPNHYEYGPMMHPPRHTWDHYLVAIMHYVQEEEILRCPSSPPRSYVQGRVYGSFIRDPRFRGWNHFKEDRIPQELDASPSDIMLLLDSVRVSDFKQVWFFAHDGFGCWQRIHLRHRKRASVVFLDGHTAPMARPDLIDGERRPVPEYQYGHWYIWPQDH